MTHRDAPDTKNGHYYRYLKSISVNPYLESVRLRFKYNKLFYSPGTCIDCKLSDWIRLIKSTDVGEMSVLKLIGSAK